MKCEYRRCENEAEGAGENWNLCKDHSDELDRLIVEGDVKKIVRFWARGQSEERRQRMADETTDTLKIVFGC